MQGVDMWHQQALISWLTVFLKMQDSQRSDLLTYLGGHVFASRTAGSHRKESCEQGPPSVVALHAQTLTVAMWAGSAAGSRATCPNIDCCHQTTIVEMLSKKASKMKMEHADTDSDFIVASIMCYPHYIYNDIYLVVS